MITYLEKLKKYKIAVISGGISSERHISLKSGKAVYETLVKGGLDARLIDVHNENYRTFTDSIDFDIAFIALHGKFGEDGQLQAHLGKKGIRYTGSGPRASMIAMDKLESKKSFIASGLRVPEYTVINGMNILEHSLFAVPCVIKPRFEGSSVGLSVVKRSEDLSGAFEEALKCGQDIIVESYIPGKEVTVGVLGKEALPVVEIKASKGVYDYESKYKAVDTEYIVPAQLDVNVYRNCQTAALTAHKSLGCKGFSRTDIRISGNGVPYLLEVNTIPGLTERSLLPMAAKCSGLDFFQLCVKMIETSVSIK